MLLPSPRTGKRDPRHTNKHRQRSPPSVQRQVASLRHANLGDFVQASPRPISLSLTARLTFIFAAFLAQLRPTSRRQSFRRALRAAKQVLEFRSVSFSRLAFVL